MKDPFGNIKRGFRAMVGSWFSLTPMETRAVILVTGLFLLGIFVKGCRTYNEPQEGAGTSVNPDAVPAEARPELP